MSQPTTTPRCGQRSGANGITAPWTDAENEDLIRLYPAAPRATVEAALPGRSWNAMGLQACVLNIKRARYWTEERLAILTAHYPTQGAAYVAQLLDCPVAKVTKQACLQSIARVFAAKPTPTPKAPKAPKPVKPTPLPKSQPKPVVEAVAQHQPARLNNLINQKASKKKNEKPLVHESLTVAEFKKLPDDHPGRVHYLRDGARGWDNWVKSQAA